MFLSNKLILAFFVFAALALFAFGYEVRTPHVSYEGTKKIEIAPGLGSRTIGALLKREGVIRSKWAFVTYVSLRNEASDLKPGIYTFSDHAAIGDIARELIEGLSEQTITIPEGWSMKDIGIYLEQTGITARKDFEDAASPKAMPTLYGQFSFLREIPAHRNLEGYLFPDTYRLYIGTPAEQVVARMLRNFDLKFSSDLHREALRQHRTIFDIVTMASLIEKEVAEDKDRALVSGILWKRLALGIPLQVDATILFLTGHKKKVLYEDTTIDSPYNTYKYKGLPKGPITNPGLSAIRAALYPQKSSYLYYLSTPENRIIFSRTLEDHNIAKAKYIR